MAMPTTSNYHPWAILPASQTCFQIYGTKRKAALGENSSASEQNSSAVKRQCLRPSAHQRQPAGQPNFPQPLTSRSKAPPSQSDRTVENRIPREFETSFPPHTSMQLEVTDNVQSICMPTTQQAFYNTAMHSHHSAHADTASTVSLNNNNQQAVDQSGGWQCPGNAQLLEQRNQNRLDMLEEVEFESNDYWDVPNDHYLLKMADEIEQARIAMETDVTPNQHEHSRSLSTSESALIPGSVIKVKLDISEMGD